ncbi:DUF2244 domain-containing protein [Terricaulis sp.]|uniref:DUF2244 domain-containing protein n=1 Tax=Terricaulis sp. TaxID=2768686 RepID=UPI002AC5B04B|nr:DUF2244 domain-containing protein [Terricaulis sp.]MDZ4689686.1 DUF2244 domain-containing protein [Terricaulis sp.]
MSGRTWFDACIRPNLAMSRRGLALVGAALLAPALIFGVVLIMFDAWPATLFLGAEALLAVIALYWCAKRLSEQWERVVLTDHALVVESWDQGKPIATQRIDPTWASIERRESRDFGCEAIFVRVRRRRVRIAQALSPKERVALADALELALHQRKTGFALRAA